MALIKSISGFRGTIGGKPGQNLTPIDVVESVAAYGAVLLERYPRPKVVMGRDARISGSIVQGLVTQTLLAQGIDVVDMGLSTTPTVEMAVVWEAAQGGIIITASHNPKEWNALKFLDEAGAFIAPQTGARMLRLLDAGTLTFASVDNLGHYTKAPDYLGKHVEAVLAHPLVDPGLIRSRGYRVVVDVVNSTGSLILPELLQKLGCEVILLNGDPTGDFAHNPEPLPEHLQGVFEAVQAHGADLGIVVDPDVDRLALVTEQGVAFGEEYTLVAISDYVLQVRPGNTVSNLSSSRALRDVTLLHGGNYFASAVGEVHVVAKMREVDAVIGGEGNGGIIVPDFHYGRDAIIGVALFLTALSRFGGTTSAFRSKFPAYEMVKDKIALTPDLDLDALMLQLEQAYKDDQLSTVDGLKVDFEEGWVHLRRSNTEPIIRIYAEAVTAEAAAMLVQNIKNQVNTLLYDASRSKS